MERGSRSSVSSPWVYFKMRWQIKTHTGSHQVTLVISIIIQGPNELFLFPEKLFQVVAILSSQGRQAHFSVGLHISEWKSVASRVGPPLRHMEKDVSSHGLEWWPLFLDDDYQSAHEVH